MFGMIRLEYQRVEREVRIPIFGKIRSELMFGNKIRIAMFRPIRQQFQYLEG